MTYKEFINNILDTRGRFACGDEYHERHHIVPKCMGGTNDEDNLIDLFAREHFIAHQLLAEENPDNLSLVYAYGCMAWAENSNQERYRISPEEYEQARISLSMAMKGKPKSAEHKAKLSERKKGQPFPVEATTKAAEMRRGISLTEEHKKHISEALKGRTLSDEHKRNISKAKKNQPLSDAQKIALTAVCEANRGRKHSEESKAKISASNKGKKMSQETKEKISKAHKGKRRNDLKKVAQYDLDGNLIKVWDCVADASRATGIDNSRIAKCAKGKYGCKTAGGFIWKFI